MVKRVRSSLTSRMDVRNRQEFADDIKTYTGIEGYVMSKWIEERNSMGVPTDAVSTGCDNSGKLIEGFVGVNHDYEVHTIDSDGVRLMLPVDVKHNYNDATCTFKAHNLEAYIKHKTWMLVVIGTGLNGRELKPPAYDYAWSRSFGRRQWALVSPTEILKITEEVPCTKIKFMGGRPGYMVFKRQFDKYFRFHGFQKI